MAKKIATTIKDPELVAQRRAEIVNVATRLFLENGFHKTSIRDIARACPFNLASLYMYVASKEDILFLVAQHLIDVKARGMAEVAIDETDPAGSFRTAFKAYCRIVHEYRRHIRLLYRELDVLSLPRREVVMASLSTVTSVFERIIRNGIERGVFTGVDAKLVALDSLFMCHLWSMHARALRTIVQDLDRFADKQCDVLLKGMLNNRKVNAAKSKKAASGARAGPSRNPSRQKNNLVHGVPILD